MWIEYLQVFLLFILNFQTQHKGRGIPRDTWSMVLHFARTVNAKLTNYDADGAWPVLLDEFVDYARDKVEK